MCHSCINNRRMDRLHESCINYSDEQSPVKELLGKESSVFFHERNLQILAPEMYMASNNFSPTHMNGSFEVRNEHSCNLRQNSVFLAFNKISI